MESGYDVETFAAWFRTKHTKQPYDLVFVDYAQELRSRSKMVTSELSEARECASVLTKMAGLAIVPVVVGSQVTIGQNGAKDITKGSRIWEEKGGSIIRVRRFDPDKDKDKIPQEYQGLANASAEVQKNRFGFRNKTVWLEWCDKHLRFREV
jgi:hypothetical protein